MGGCCEITLAENDNFLAYRDPCPGRIDKYGGGGSTRGYNDRWMCNRPISFVVIGCCLETADLSWSRRAK